MLSLLQGYDMLLKIQVTGSQPGCRAVQGAMNPLSITYKITRRIAVAIAKCGNDSQILSRKKNRSRRNPIGFQLDGPLRYGEVSGSPG